jgi:phenylacetate-CoA ligase
MRLHVNEDHFYPEISTPLTNLLPRRAKRANWWSPVDHKGFPALALSHTGYFALMRESCAAGGLARMERVSGRTADMLIIRGVNVFPSQIESVLVTVEGIEPHYEIVVSRTGSLDDIEIRVEVSEEIFSDEVRGLEDLRKKISHEIESVLGLTATIRLVEPKSIARSEGKAKRVIDNRNK